MRPDRIGILGVTIALAQGCGWLFQDYREVASTTTGGGGSATATSTSSVATSSSSGGGGQGTTTGTGSGGSPGKVCGDGTRVTEEECDDGNMISGDGCSSDCLVECSEILDPSTKHCYRVGVEKSWADASADCKKWQGELIGLGSSTELPWLLTATSLGADPIWIGANDKGSMCVFRNANGEPVWPHFAPEEPNFGVNETCVALVPQGNPATYLMYDLDCTAHHNYLCERAPGGSCGDGIVQLQEQCDDGNSNDLDRCTNNCKVQCLPGEQLAATTRRCYSLSQAALSGADAHNLACLEGFHLASITSEEENAAVHAVAGGNQVWLGAKWVNPSQGSVGTGLIWFDSSARCAYTNWLASSPSPTDALIECVKMNADGTWSNVACVGSTLPSVCMLDL